MALGELERRRILPERVFVRKGSGDAIASIQVML
jgi:hypothetical protein